MMSTTGQQRSTALHDGSSVVLAVIERLLERAKFYEDLGREMEGHVGRVIESHGMTLRNEAADLSYWWSDIVLKGGSIMQGDSASTDDGGPLPTDDGGQ